MTKTAARAAKDLNFISWLLRVGLAFVLIYAAVGSLRQPDAWIGFVPHFSERFMAAKTALDLLSVCQLLLAAWLVSGRYLKYAASLTAAMLLGIIIFDWSSLIITFRDVGLFCMALALVVVDS